LGLELELELKLGRSELTVKKVLSDRIREEGAGLSL